jgi:hypothetical protein
MKYHTGCGVEKFFGTMECNSLVALSRWWHVTEVVVLL